MSKRNLFMILVIMILLAIYYKHYFNFGGSYDSDGPLSQNESQEKMEDVLHYVNRFYVDEVSWDKSITGAIEGLLATLDPHSVYFTPEEVRQNEENFHGRYYGIGIHYDIIDGFVTVLSVIAGSPSEKAGILAGDRIIEIEGISAENISRADVPRRLKGEKGTKVNVKISRQDIKEPLEFRLTRDEIPISTLNTFFMADNITGYIWLSQFAMKSAEEVETALILLEKRGMKRLVLDLRGNVGGLLSQAVEIVGKFIHGSKLVVYTKSKEPGSLEEYFTDDYGKSIKREFPLIIVINQNSASASEIVAGAIQDYDRGLVVGTTSFGKGLVQNEYGLDDGSRIRLTVSKYYTPSGRLIQRPYDGKNREEYYHRLDSVARDTSENRPLYNTMAGRKVFGGGGITPDVTIENKNLANNITLMYQFIQNGILVDFASWYVNTYEPDKSDFDSFQSVFVFSNSFRKNIIQFARDSDLDVSLNDVIKDRRFLSNRIQAEIARSVWGIRRYWEVILEEDNQFQEALVLFPKALEMSRLDEK